MSSRSQNPLLYLFCKAWEYAEEQRRKVGLFWFMFIISETIDTFFLPFVWAKMIDVVTKQGIGPDSIQTLGILLFCVFLRTNVVWGLHGPARFMEQNTAFMIRTNYRRRLLQGLMVLPLEWHTEHHSGETTDKINKGTNALYDFSENAFQIIYSLVRFIGCCGMLIYLSPSSAIIAFVMIVISALIVIRFDKILLKNYQALSHTENDISKSIADAANNISTIIILRVEKLVFRSIMAAIQKPYELVRETSRLNEWKWYWTSLCSSFMTVTVLAFYFWRHYGTAGGVLVGTFYLVLNYLDRVGNIFFDFAGMYGDIVKRMARVTNSEELTADFKAESFSNHVLPKDWQDLRVRNLSFSYHSEDGKDLHLDNVAFDVHNGEKIALVGGTGAGKSTLLKVFRDLYHPASLDLNVDGNNLVEGFAGISRAISLVPQEPEIFDADLWHNITLGANYEMDFVQRFTDMACFTDVVRSFPKGFKTSIKEKGVNLSVGQKQRLALARGLLGCHDKEIILLDEPTSSLDALTQIVVYQNILREFSEKTIISTLHQLQLLPLFDRVCVFDQGQIVGSGTISELLGSCPKFVSLWNAIPQTNKMVTQGN